jgi:spore coat polysaccharide biosynthesis predicted glycosyltransferase SpsG
MCHHLLIFISAKDGYDWVNPKNDKIYLPGGISYYHSLLLQIPVIHGEKIPQWQNQFLTQYWFEEEAVLKCVGRTISTMELGVAKFLDMVIYTKEVTPMTEFTCQL